MYRKAILRALTSGILLAAMAGVGMAAEDNATNPQSRMGMGEMMMNGPMMGYGRMGGYEPMGGYGPMVGYDSQGMLDRIDGRLAFIKTELALRKDQTSQWDDLATVIRNNAETHNDMMQAMMERMHGGESFELPLPERLTIMETHMEARVEQIRTLHEAVDTLYSELDDDQRKTVDEILLPVATGMGSGMMMGTGRGIMMDPGPNMMKGNSN